MRATLSLIFVLLAGPCLAQGTLTFPVHIDTVVVVGNEKTHNSIIIREIPFEVPGEINEEDLILVQNRLTNLFLFNRVQLDILPYPDQNILFIQVTEMWYIYPVPIFFLNNRSWDDLSYGFQLSHFNFRGRNEKVSLGGWLGYNPSFFTRYRNPWIGNEARLIFSMNFFGRRVGNRLFDSDADGRFSSEFSQFNERHLSGRVAFGKRLSLFTSVEVGFSLRQVVMPDETDLVLPTGWAYENLTASGSGTDLVPQCTLQVRTDHRDLIEYPTSGYYARWRVIRSGVTESQPQYWRFDFDNRLYIKFHERIALASRNRTILNSGTLPVYDRSYIGFAERIRGHFDTPFTSQHLMIHNYELRVKLVPFRYFSWKQAPMMNNYFQQLKYGLSLGLFVDSGIVWGDGLAGTTIADSEFNLENHVTGFGAGLHFHLPYIYLLRVDHAWNDESEREWIVEAQFAF